MTTIGTLGTAGATVGAGGVIPGAIPESATPDSAHKTVISIGVMVLVLILLITFAGQSHEVALGVGALLLSVVLLAGFNTPASTLKRVSSYPSLP